MNMRPETAKGVMPGWISRLFSTQPAWTATELADRIASRAKNCNSLYLGDKTEEARSLKQWRNLALHLLDAHPDNLDAWKVLGHAEFRIAYEGYANQRDQHYEASKRAYQAAARLGADARTWINLGEVCFHSDDLKGRFVAYRVALDIDPDNRSALYGLGKAYAKAGQHQDAVKLFRRSLEGIRGEGDDSFSHIDLGMSELYLGNREQAMEAFLVATQGIAFNMLYKEIAVAFYGHNDWAAEFHSRLAQTNPCLAEKFLAAFQPMLGTVIYAKGYYRIKSDGGQPLSDYFITGDEVEAAGIARLRLGDRVEFKTGSARQVLANHFKVVSRPD
jgi:tetratricopeptide (TPR) repeat protein